MGSGKGRPDVPGGNQEDISMATLQKNGNKEKELAAWLDRLTVDRALVDFGG